MAPYADKVATVGGTHVHRRTRRGGKTPPLEKFRGELCFQGKRKLLENPKCKKYIQYSAKILGKLCFKGKRKLLKIQNVKSIFNTVKKFRANSVSQGKRKLLKNKNGEKIFKTVYPVMGVGRIFSKGESNSGFFEW